MNNVGYIFSKILHHFFEQIFVFSIAYRLFLCYIEIEHMFYSDKGWFER